MAAISALALASCGAPTGKTTAPRYEHVLVIGLDGVATEALRAAATPVMDSLIATGAVAYDMRTVLPTVSTPNWAAMIYGAGPEATGISSNGWRADTTGVKPGATIFDVVRQQKPQAEQGAIFHWGGIGQLIPSEAVNRLESHPSADKTVAELCNYIVEKRPAFAFTQLDHIDGAGHRTGYFSEECKAAIAHADSLVGDLMTAIRTAGIADRTLVIVASDHGGFANDHGGMTVEETRVPIIFNGRGVKAGTVVTDAVYMYDVAANAAWALGLTQPQAWTGRPTLSAFEN